MFIVLLGSNKPPGKERRCVLGAKYFTLFAYSFMVFKGQLSWTLILTISHDIQILNAIIKSIFLDTIFRKDVRFKNLRE